MTNPIADPSITYLANLIKQQSNAAKPSNIDMAKYVLANSTIKFGADPAISHENKSPGLLSRIVDILSRPNYAVANAFNYAAQRENPFEGFIKGIEGKEKTTFSDVLDTAGVDNPVLKGLGGFGLDIVLDPTTYVGPGAVFKGLKSLGKGAKAAEEIGDVAKVTKELPVPKSNVPEQEIANPGTMVSVASKEQNKTLQQALSVLPDASAKAKPVPNLNDLQKFAVDESLKKLPKSSAKVNTKFADTINPSQQLHIWNKVAAESKNLFPKNQAKQFESAYHMMIHAENMLENAGSNLRNWDGSKFKLSDIIAEMSTGKGVKFAKDMMPKISAELRKVNIRIKDPNIAQGIHNVRVRSAIQDSQPVKEALDAAIQQNNILGQEPLSDARLSKLFNAIPALAERHAVDLGASAAGGDAARDLTRDVISKQSSPNPNSVKKALGIPEPDFKSPMNGRGKVEEHLIGKILSWYGQKDLRPITEQHLLTAANSTWLRTAALKRFSDKFTESQQLEAIRYAQGLPGANATQLGNIYKQTLENLFKGSGLTDAAWKANTVAGKADLLMNRLNVHLKRTQAPWRFTNKKIKNPVTGQEMDFSKGTDWLKSWQAWDVKDSANFFPKIQGAVETATHEKAIFDDIAERFGSPVAGNGYTHTLDYPYLKGVHFTKDIADQIPRVIRDIDEFFDGGGHSQFIKSFDKITRVWKYGVTLPNPSHHIRNLLGDTYMNWMAGVNSVRPYNYAMQVMRSQKQNYKGINEVENLVQAGAIDRAMGKTPNPKEILFRNKSGQGFTAEQIYVGAHQMGILPQAHVIEDILGNDTPIFKGIRPFKGKLKSKLEAFSETREHFARLAHFIDVVKKSSGKDFQDIFKKAGFTVRKWHPDYLTLTPFEKKFLRRVMPFYSWTRRAIPLVIESTFLNPGKTLVYPKAMQALQESLGIDAPSRSDPFPNDQKFPEWVRNLGIGPLFDHPVLGARGVTDVLGNNIGDTIINPGNPTFDIGSQFSNPLQGVGGLLHPAIKIPAELLTKTQINTGAPINSGNLAEYLGNQIPGFSTLQGITGVTPALGDTSRAQKEGNINTERIINWLTALGLRGTGPYIKQATFEERDK